MTDKELAEAISLLNLSIERKYAKLAKLYDDAAERADKAAGDDRMSQAAEIALGFKALSHKADAGGSNHKADHCQASILGAKAISLPMPRSGDR